MASFTLPTWMQPWMQRDPAPADPPTDAADLGTELGLEAALPQQDGPWLVPQGTDGGHAQTRPAPLDLLAPR